MLKGISAGRILGNNQHFVGVISAGRGGRERPSLRFVKCDCFFYDVAKPRKYLPFVVSVTASVEQSWTTTNEALVLIRPTNKAMISVFGFHGYPRFAETG